jgi:hypothetical protein
MRLNRMGQCSENTRRSSRNQRGPLPGSWRACGTRPQVRPADRSVRPRRWERCTAPLS